MTTLTRYFLLQLPSWMLAAALLAVLHRWIGLPLWAAVVAWAVYIAKDVLLYAKLRRAYEIGAPSGAEALIGKLAVVKQPLDPEGYVEIAGELWQARATESEVILAGTRVRIVGADGMVLTVNPE